MADVTPESNQELFILDKRKPFYQSILWEIQRNFFDNKDIEAWSDGAVPHYITNNPFIARAYAWQVIGFWQDWWVGHDLDAGQLLYIAGQFYVDST